MAVGEETGDVETPALKPLTDDEVAELTDKMQTLQLSTDKHSLVVATLDGRSLSCGQGAKILQAISSGMMQRKFATQVLRDHFSDLPTGLEEVLAPLSGPVRKEVAAALAAQPPASSVAGFQRLGRARPGTKSVPSFQERLAERLAAT
eukprot:CAMPEP_0203896720 /NCGR_PEP_ID=MMETSP0359-20131031/39430_1 /ASSEMBLY_ACC=CAM_ASM_000338 /TAXON_ID=268821 /ORGANISM="Scrippsiella Hangoei, Strain SHTV-5" /LENGTH=147 /DNA_ID=CAMNT_0050819449 /DNA_START=83 /DNA_END=523 /DNA_ORIENTATION=+